MIRKISYIFLFFVITIFVLTGRELKIEEFVQLPFDISARSNSVNDKNGVMCALIKVKLPVEGCKFEGNVVQSKYDVNEYWVYMTRGTKRLDIKCPGVETISVVFAEISDIETLESGSTYQLRLSGYETQAPKKADAGFNFLVLDIEPKSATGVSVYINGEQKPVSGNKSSSLLKYGNYTFKIQADGFDTYEGTATIAQGEKTEIPVKLKSAMARLIVRTDMSGASISINSEQKGVDTWSGDLFPGNYMIEVTKEGYQPYSELVTLAKLESKVVNVPALTPMYGNLVADYQPIGSKVMVDGKEVGVTPVVLSEILSGRHEILIYNNGYENFNTIVNIEEGKTVSLAGSLKQKTVSHPSQQTADNTTNTPNTTQQTSQSKFEWAVWWHPVPHNLDLLVKRNGTDYYISAYYWLAVPNVYKYKYDFEKIGIVIMRGKQPFILDLKYSEPMTWAEAVKQYGEEALLTGEQCEILGLLWHGINSCIKQFEGKEPDKYANSFWGKGTAPDLAWRVDLGEMRGQVNSSSWKGNSASVRLTRPLTYKLQKADNEPQNLDLCAIRDGKICYINAEEWEKMSDKEQREYTPKGIVFTNTTRPFIVGLYAVPLYGSRKNDLIGNIMDWHSAEKLFPENMFPNEEELGIINKNQNIFRQLCRIYQPGVRFPGLISNYNLLWGKQKNEKEACALSIDKKDPSYKSKVVYRSKKDKNDTALLPIVHLDDDIQLILAL